MLCTFLYIHFYCKQYSVFPFSFIHNLVKWWCQIVTITFVAGTLLRSVLDILLRAAGHLIKLSFWQLQIPKRGEGLTPRCAVGWTKPKDVLCVQCSLAGLFLFNDISQHQYLISILMTNSMIVSTRHATLQLEVHLKNIKHSIVGQYFRKWNLLFNNPRLNGWELLNCSLTDGYILY